MYFSALYLKVDILDWTWEQISLEKFGVFYLHIQLENIDEKWDGQEERMPLSLTAMIIERKMIMSRLELSEKTDFLIVIMHSSEPCFGRFHHHMSSPKNKLLISFSFIFSLQIYIACDSLLENNLLVVLHMDVWPNFFSYFGVLKFFPFRKKIHFLVPPK